MEMAVLAKDRIEVRNILRTSAPDNDQTETIHELETSGETEAEKRKMGYTQSKKITWENNATKVRERERKRER